MPGTIDDYLRHDSQRLVNDLRKLCRQPSISAQNVGMEECAGLVAELMEDSGIHTRVIRVPGGYPVVYGERRTSKAAPTLLFYNHYDVQPPEPLGKWRLPPFGATVASGKIFSRGVADDKGDLVARMKAVEALVAVQKELPVNLKFLVEGEEEIGSPHMNGFVEGHRKMLSADSCVWESGNRDASGRPEIFLGVKGMLYVELKTKTASIDQHSMYAAIVANPAWRLLWALNSLKDINGRILLEGFYDRVKKPPPDAVKALDGIVFDEEKYMESFGIDSYLGKVKGHRLLRKLIFDPTCTICGFQSGYTGPGSKTVNPAEASAKIDFRLVPDQDPEELFGKLKIHLRKRGFGDLDLIRLHAQKPARTSMRSPLVKLAVETARKVYRQEPSVWPNMPGTGPMSIFIDRLGLPTLGVGVAYYDSRIHAPNENIRIEDFLLGIKHIAGIISAFAKA